MDEMIDYLTGAFVDNELAEGRPVRNVAGYRVTARRRLLENEAQHPGYISQLYYGVRRQRGETTPPPEASAVATAASAYRRARRAGASHADARILADEVYAHAAGWTALTHDTEKALDAACLAGDEA